jgi:hypothetical protein
MVNRRIGRPNVRAVPKILQRSNHVEWNSEAGRVSGVILKKAVFDVKVNGYVHHASKDEPQYFIKSDNRPRGHPQRPSADTHQGSEEIKANSGNKEGNIIDFVAQ